MSFVWVRGTNASSLWFADTQAIGAMSAGETLVRARFRWGFYGDTAFMTDLNAVSNNIRSWGIVTTIGNGTETVPNARTAANNASPPAQRWVYWETRAPTISAVDVAGNYVAWRDSGSSEMTESRGQVKAPNMSPGDQMNIWVSQAAAFSWDPSGSTTTWFGWEILIKIP